MLDSLEFMMALDETVQSSVIITWSDINSKILHKWLQALEQNVHQMLDPQNTPYTSP